MKIGPSGFCMPVSNGCTALRREAVFKKSPNPSGVPCRGEALPWVVPKAPRPLAVVSLPRGTKRTASARGLLAKLLQMNHDHRESKEF
jgi:hypothetical protein